MRSVRTTLTGAFSGLRATVTGHGVSAAKAATAAVLAWIVAGWLLPAGSDFYAPLVAVLSVQPTVAGTLRDTVQRLAGVGIGLAIGYVVTATVGLHWWSLGAVLAVAVLSSTWHRLGDEGVQVSVAALLVLLLAEEPTLYVGQLLGEGLIGGLVAAAVNIAVIPPLQVGVAERALVTLRHRLGDLVDDMSAQVGGEWPPEEQRWIARARELDDPLRDAREAVQTGGESTRFNPRGRRFRHVPPGQRQSFESLENVTLAVRDLATSLSEAADPDDPALHLNELFRPALARALRSVAEALTSYGSPEGSADTAAEGRPVAAAAREVEELRRLLAESEAPEVPALLAEGAVVTELGRLVAHLQRAPLHH
ncbi:FUSC family protein [Blastococcus capsensis]|uniref:FUSC family protein n=1 Tax=Blastococcus capsensis TaxID=1564163 RepID=UPI002540E891|nr:aromatic acid exporter family protein [Blastococcus capsensis]MDK3255053.1 aromatic acid exporter family protein [Blastococcus capsensis]